MRHAQTATEYLIILAVVIIIALLVIGTLGGIPGIGGGISGKTSAVALQTQSIGITHYAVGTNHTLLVLRNNLANTVEINDISINFTTCVPYRMLFSNFL